MQKLFDGFILQQQRTFRLGERQLETGCQFRPGLDDRLAGIAVAHVITLRGIQSRQSHRNAAVRIGGAAECHDNPRPVRRAVQLVSQPDVVAGQVFAARQRIIILVIIVAHFLILFHALLHIEERNAGLGDLPVIDQRAADTRPERIFVGLQNPGSVDRQEKIQSVSVSLVAVRIVVVVIVAAPQRCAARGRLQVEPATAARAVVDQQARKPA